MKILFRTRRGAGMIRIVIGTLMLILAPLALLGTQANWKSAEKAINEARAAVVELADISKINTSMNGKLVHAIGLADSQETMLDDEFHVRAERVLQLSRNVTYFQWTETKTTRRDNTGRDETTYTYDKEWTDEPVNIGGFSGSRLRTAFYFDRDSNDPIVKIASEVFDSPNVTFGTYRLPRFILQEIENESPFEFRLTNDEIESIATTILRRANDRLAKRAELHIGSTRLYVGSNPNDPETGDVRLSFTYTPPTEISLIAVVEEGSFQPFKVSDGEKFHMVAMGRKSADEMLGDLESSSEEDLKAGRCGSIVIAVIGVLLFYFGKIARKLALM